VAKANKPRPEWFDLARYAEAADLDAGEWLLNLLLRGWVARTGDAFGVSVTQGPRPVLRRGDPEQVAAFDWHFFVNQKAEAAAPAGLRDLLNARPLSSGIHPLSVVGLYFFEGRLPAEIRQFGARFEPGGTKKPTDPAAFYGRLDHAFTQQMTGRFVRVDLALPDSVLLHDLATFLRRERDELAAMGGPQPYREAVRLAEKTRPRLSTLATIGLLPFLDLQSWLKSRTPTPSEYAVAEMIGTERRRMAEVHVYAARCMQDLVLRAWLEPAARGIPSKSKRRR
jgi:hypothetical protein